MSLKTIITNNDYENSENVQEIVKYLMSNYEQLGLSNATLYYKYPKYDNDNSLLVPDLFIISPNHGVIVINVCNKAKRNISDSYVNDFFDRLDDLDGLITSQFLKVKSLKKNRREIAVPISTLAYFTNIDVDEIPERDFVKSLFNLTDFSQILQDITVNELPEDILKDIYSIIDGSRSIPKESNRELNDKDNTSKGYMLSLLEKQIATFDFKQQLAALTVVDGPQRIRGMAGSGKTVVLAMKAAQLHINNPESKILYTFYTKSLYDQVKRLITRFYRMTQDHDPNWDNLQIYHAWGGQQKVGVYYNACIDNDMRPLNYSVAAKKASENRMKPFEYICYNFLEQKNHSIKKKYDYVLIDEGQDFPSSFYWLCRKLVVNDRIIWAYDELQNILDIEQQDTKKLFENPFGDKGIDLEELVHTHPHQSNDIILHTSYRNPKEILIIAHSLGFGIYNDRIIQMLENKEHWNDLGYTVECGGESGEDTIISRSDKNSPSIISSKYNIDDIFMIERFNDIQEEMDYVSQCIQTDINNKLLPEDILVICLDDRFNRDYFEKLSLRLSKYSISINNIMISAAGDNFTVKDKITFSTVYRAKGNEAGKVYIIGADSLKNKNSISVRNKIFTAITRSKAWVTITGIHIDTDFIANEFDQVRANDLKMKFKYPTKDEIERTLQRELADENYKLNQQREKLLKAIDDTGLTVSEATRILEHGGKDV